MSTGLLHSKKEQKSERVQRIADAIVRELAINPQTHSWLKSRIAKREGCTAGAVGRALRRLDRQGYIEPLPAAEKRERELAVRDQGVWLRLTQKGENYLRSLPVDVNASSL